MPKVVTSFKIICPFIIDINHWLLWQKLAIHLFYINKKISLFFQWYGLLTAETFTFTSALAGHSPTTAERCTFLIIRWACVKDLIAPHLGIPRSRLVHGHFRNPCSPHFITRQMQREGFYGNPETQASISFHFARIRFTFFCKISSIELSSCKTRGRNS